MPVAGPIVRSVHAKRTFVPQNSGPWLRRTEADTANARRAPSGDHTGADSFSGVLVRRLSRLSASDRTQMSPPRPNATRSPSGAGTIPLSASGVVQTARGGVDP